MEEDLMFRRLLKMKVSFRPTAEREKYKGTTLEAYCPFCKTTIKEYGQERCSICEVGLDWNFAIAWD